MENSGFLKDAKKFAEAKQTAVFTFDESMNGYIAIGEQAFTCPDCLEIPDFDVCGCEKVWNIYQIIADNQVKTIAREMEMPDPKHRM